MEKVANRKPVRKRGEELVGLKDFRLNIKTYIDKLEKGDSFTVIKYSKPVFRAVPPYEENMEEVIDFTQFSPNGVSAKKLLRALKALE